MNHKVWVLGDAVVDLIPLDDTSYLKCPGGAPANVAVAIARLAGSSAFIGRVGHDPLGRFLKETLQKEKVSTESMVLDPDHGTSTVLVDLDDDGERSFHFLVKPSADQFLTQEDLPVFSKGDWLHFCSIALANEPSRSATFEAIKRIQAVGGWVSFDPNLRLDIWSKPEEWREVVMQALKLADVIKLSEEEVHLISNDENTDSGVQTLKSQLSAKALLVTLGSKGTDWYPANAERERIPSRPANVVDTTGAGDAFVGGLLHKLAEQSSGSADDCWFTPVHMKQAIIQANACGAMATTEKGAMTALPCQKQLSSYFAG